MIDQQQLVTIAPPLTQSLYEKMCCPRGYATEIIEGRRLPGNLNSWRGTEVHRVLASYAWHCKQRQVEADWAEFDRLAAGVSNDAAEILAIQRDYMRVDYGHLVFAELTLCMDENFQPVVLDDPEVIPPNAVFKATLDAGYRLDDIHFVIDDYKSHPQPFEADTMQAMLSPLLVFQHKPELRAVTFNLKFVRYRNVVRSVTWTRADIPNMQAELRRARARQISLHAAHEAEDFDLLPALPNPGCHYCPLLVNGGCPVIEENPYKQEAPDLVFELRWLDERRAQVRELLKAHEQARGTITVKDANGNEMSFGTAATESEAYFAKDILPPCQEWAAATNDWDFVNALRISSTTIKQKLKTKKRAKLREDLEPLIHKVTKTSTKLRMRNIGEEQQGGEDWSDE